VVAKRRRTTRRKRTLIKRRRRNPTPAIISWAAGNPGTKRRRTMAAGRKRRRVAKKSYRRRRNPAGLGRPMDWIQGGAGVLVGVVGARALPQIVLGASNSGVMGYVGNVVASLGLGWVTHMVFPHSPVLTASVVAGGFAGTLARVISDKTPFGAQLSLTGLGDWGLGLYKKSNFPYPARLQNGALHSAGNSMFTWGDGSQGMSTLATVGADSTAAC
jgi:hypothetical protein